MKAITIPINKGWGEIPKYKTIFNISDEVASYIKNLEDTIKVYQDKFAKYKSIRTMQYKDLQTECPNCKTYINIVYPIPALSEYHGDMYISQEMEYQERKRLQADIKEIKRILDSAKKHYKDDKTNWAIERALKLIEKED